MKADGKAIAEEMKHDIVRDIKRLPEKPRLAILVTQELPVIRKFINLKKAYADAIGVEMIEHDLSQLQKQEDFLHMVFRTAREADGIVVQLPLAPRIHLDAVRQILPATHDVDVLGVTAYEEFTYNRLPVMPPVVGAMAQVLARHQMTLRGKRVVVIGAGRLVGAPAAIWAKRMGGSVTVISEPTDSLADTLLDADVILSGAGVPGLIQPDMIQSGVIILDAGTSEAGGKLVGDADPLCEEKAALFTPTPGGIGPITVAMLFKNLVTLSSLKQGVALDGVIADEEEK